MFYQSCTARTVLGSAVFFLSFLPAVGQTDSNKDRTASGNTNSAVRRDRTQSRSRGGRANAAVKLPFEQSVIIYYKGPGKTSATIAPSKPPVSTPPTDQATRKGGGPQKQLNYTAVPLAAQPATLRLPRRTDTTAGLQPVIIYYRTYEPAAIVRSPVPRPVSPNVKPAAPASRIKNESAANPSPGIKPKQATQPAGPSIPVSSGPAPLAERPKPTDVTPGVGNEIPPTNAEAKLNETLSAAPKPPPEPVVNSIAPANSGESVNSTGGPQGNQGQPLEPVIKNSEPLSEGIRLNNLGVSHFRDGRYEDAAATLENAVKMGPLHGTTLLNLSVTYAWLNRLDEAAEAASRAVEMLPDRLDAREYLCHLYLNAKNASDAVGCYEYVRKMVSNNPSADVGYGTALFLTGEKDKALDVLEKAAAAFPNNGEAHFTLGVVQFKMKKNKAAVDSLKRAVESEPDQATYRYNLAIALIAVQNSAGALSQYNLLKTSDPEIAAQLYKILFADKVYSVDKK